MPTCPIRRETSWGDTRCAPSSQALRDGSGQVAGRTCERLVKRLRRLAGSDSYVPFESEIYRAGLDRSISNVCDTAPASMAKKTVHLRMRQKPIYRFLWALESNAALSEGLFLKARTGSAMCKSCTNMLQLNYSAPCRSECGSTAVTVKILSL